MRRAQLHRRVRYRLTENRHASHQSHQPLYQPATCCRPGCRPDRDISSAHVTFLTEPEWRALGNGLPATHRPAIPLGKRGLHEFRRFPRSPRLPQAKDHPPRTQGSAGRRHRGALADRHGPHRSRLGRLFRILHGHRLAQMGPALSDARVLFDRRHRKCATASCW